MLRVEGVPAIAGGPGFSFAVPAGASLGLLGVNAAVLQRFSETLAGLRMPLAGRVLINDLDSVRDCAGVRARVSMCMPRAAHARVTLLEHLRLIAAVRVKLRLPVADVLARLALDPHTRLTDPGARGAAALAGALLPDSSLVILHDPFAGLSEPTRRAAIEWIRSLAATSTAVITTGTDEGSVRAISQSVIPLESAP
jgi:ABC-type multidrug transport system ATPase subunit